MEIIYILISSYVLIVFLCTLYVKRGRISKTDKSLIIVLSGKNERITRDRLRRALELNKLLKSEVVVSGKIMSKYMVSFLEENGIKNPIVQSKSMTTEDDAKLLRKIISYNNRQIILVTSPTHQRRAWHHFEKFTKSKIYNCPSSLFFSFDSILTPIGWAGVVMNITKDYKYNHKIW